MWKVPSLGLRTLAAVTGPPRLVVELSLSLPGLVAEIPGLARDLRVLVGGLASLSQGASPGALTDVVGNLARLSDADGELTVLLREAARLAAARAEESRVRSTVAASLPES